MATLVLTAAGALLGPVGGAIGAFIGQAIDSRVFGAGSRQGPRLQDLKVQTSSYGAPIARLFGTLRVAGTVIWSTDLIEHRSRQSGGKGRPSTTRYSYSASFAVLLSGRPIRSVGRIWADGNLLRGAAGDWKSETGFRLHLGDEDQAVDPFIASAEAGEATPAYRGCAYAVFENMALEAFGNRIPSLTFEVEADSGPRSVGEVLHDLSGGLVTGEGPELRGFAASGESVAGLIQQLARGVPLDLSDDGDRLRIVTDSDPIEALSAAEVREGGSETLAARARLPSSLSLSYYEPARDYQAGVQSARRLGDGPTRSVELPAALSADEARTLAEDAIARIAREQGQRMLACGWRRINLCPGRLVRVDGDAGIWRVAERAVSREGVRLELRRAQGASLSAGASDPGRGVPARDQVHGPTVVHLLDIPNLEDVAPAVPRLLIAAAGSSPGWRRADLLVSLDQGTSWTAIGGTAAPAIMGTSDTKLLPAAAALIDETNNVVVELLHGEMELAGADDVRLLGGANLALLGSELIQFGAAIPLGDRRWRLSRLLRGRRGTERAGATHQAGDRFVLIEPGALLPYDPPAGAVGTEVRLLASSLGDGEPVMAQASAIGEALRMPAPVHLTASRRPDGGFDLKWTRSSRLGWSWLDGADVPLGEAEERYRLTIVAASGPARTYELTASSFVYASEEAVTDLTAGPVIVDVRQLGSGVASREARLVLTA